MHLQVLGPVIASALLGVSGCGPSQSAPLADYQRFDAESGQWVINVEGIKADQIEIIRATVEAVSGVQEGSVLISAEGEYVAFKTTVSSKDGKARGAVAGDVDKKLEELDMKTRGSKTHAW
jgi:hypothetical protein